MEFLIFVNHSYKAATWASATMLQGFLANARTKTSTIYMHSNNNVAIKILAPALDIHIATAIILPLSTQA